MPDTSHTLKPSLSFAKLVATPTDTAWSQAYNAGNLFACLSVSVEEKTEEISLPSIGKDILNLLESEFFTLEDKSIEAIKKAIHESLSKIPSSITTDLTLIYFKDNTLLVFIAGSGKVIMKRGESMGTLLEKHARYDGTITSAFGKLENGDTLILQTGQFSQGISEETITGALDLSLPNDIVEAISPQMHEQDNGAQAAIVASYRGGSLATHTDKESEEESTLASLYTSEDPALAKAKEFNADETLEKKRPSFSLPKISLFHDRLTHKRKLFLTIAIIIVVLLTISISFAMKKQSDANQQKQFQAIYGPAKQYYDEGKGLESLNKNLSQESYRKAEQLLKEGEEKLTKGSNEYKQMTDLLAQVENALENNTPASQTNTKEVSATAHSLLAVEKELSGKGFGQDASNVYIVTDKAVSSVTKSSGAKKDIIQNDNDWATPQAVIPYQNNIYILDKKKGVLKYIQSSGKYTKTAYFTGSVPNLSKATSMAIDSSVWILLSDGTILKYTKGQTDNLKVTGLETAFNNPTKIVATIDMSNVYIMDNGNSRIVKLDKKGNYQTAYSANVLAKAKDLEVMEKEKKILILSENKIWEIAL